MNSVVMAKTTNIFRFQKVALEMNPDPEEIRQTN